MVPVALRDVQILQEINLAGIIVMEGVAADFGPDAIS
jgi:hypothetical protein